MKKSSNTPPSTLPPTSVPTLTDPGLWDGIQAQHARLAGDAAFVARLRAEKAFSGPDPGPVILEFLRFAYLAWTMPGGATPSKVVDEVWHTFILFTRSYERFCYQAKGAMLHHDPGGGGQADEARFQEAYSRTLERYEAEFGPAPPAYWPRPAVPKAEPPTQVPKRTAPPTVSLSKTSIQPAKPARTSGPDLRPLLLALAFAVSLGTYAATASPAAALAALALPALLLILIANSGPSAASPAPRKPAPRPARKASSTSTTSSSSCGGDGGVSFLSTSSGGHHSGGDNCGSGSGGSDGGSSGGGSSCGSSCGGGGCGGG